MDINGFTFNKIEQWQVDYLKENYHLKITDLMKALQLCDETIYRMLNALEIKRERLRKISIPHDEEAKNLMLNPYLSHVKIADRYNCSPEAVAKRRQLLGVTVRRNMSSTRLEDKVSSALDELDFVYTFQKKIDKWSIDFYLGHKYCIDVHGEWAHSKNKNVERDIRKASWLNENGYKYLVVLEDQVDSAKELIKQFTLGFPQS